MATVNEVYRALDIRAPFERQMDFDNAGHLVGRGAQAVSRILVSLDITQEVVEEAAACGAELIVSHHPIIFHPVRRLTDADPTGRILLLLAEHQISAICAHTNLDVAREGVNDALARRLELQDIGPFQIFGREGDGSPYGLGRIGTVSGFTGCSVKEFSAYVKERLSANGVRYEDAGRRVHRVAVGGGACGDLFSEAAAAGCDTLVTADVKYNHFLDARALGINLIDAGHFPTEQVVCPVLVRWLQEDFPSVRVHLTQRHREVFSYL